MMVWPGIYLRGGELKTDSKKRKLLCRYSRFRGRVFGRAGAGRGGFDNAASDIAAKPAVILMVAPGRAGDKAVRNGLTADL